jgi:hypothetical protein
VSPSVDGAALGDRGTEPCIARSVLWTFTNHAELPPTNHSAEQALGPAVLKRKINGPTRSRRGANLIARGFSVAETCRRQARDLLDYLQRSVCARIDKTEPPLLLKPVLV